MLRLVRLVVLLTLGAAAPAALGQIRCSEEIEHAPVACAEDALNGARALGRIEWAKACGQLVDAANYNMGSTDVDAYVAAMQLDVYGRPLGTLMYPVFTRGDRTNSERYFAPAPLGAVTAADCQRLGAPPPGVHPCTWCPAYEVKVACRMKAHECNNRFEPIELQIPFIWKKPPIPIPPVLVDTPIPPILVRGAP